MLIYRIANNGEASSIINDNDFENNDEMIHENVDDHIFINDNQLGVQKFDIKYPTFDDPYINPMDLRNITYKKTEEELNNLISLIHILEIKYIQLLNFQQDKLETFFKTYSVCKDCSRVFIVGFKRILTLFSLLLKIRFDPIEKLHAEKIATDDYLISEEIYINNFFNYDDFKQIVQSDNEKFLGFIECFKMLKSYEDSLSRHIYSGFVPSLSGIFFALKIINNYIESTIKDCENLIIEINEEIVVELLLNVK